MGGRQSLWRVWRAESPSGPRVRAAAMSRLRVWAGYLDPDFSHSQRVARLALLLYDGLKDAGLVIPGAGNPAPANSAPLNGNLNTSLDMNYEPRRGVGGAGLMRWICDATRA